MKPLVFHLPGDEDFADGLIRALGAQRAALQLHRFPDGESLLPPSVMPCDHCTR